jgi:hypothetical protein
MQVRLSRAEYWLLETVVEDPCPVSLLDAARYQEANGVELMLNKAGHGLDREELIETLTALARERLIEGNRQRLIDGDRRCEPIALDSQSIIAAFAERHPADCYTTYRLTRGGGDVWQTFAAPDWSGFVKQDLDDDAQTGSLTGLTAWRVEKYLQYLDMFQCELDFASVRMNEMGPWEATYWKTLPKGHRAEFRYRRRLEAPVGSDISRLAFSGFCEFRDGWYGWR